MSRYCIASGAFLQYSRSARCEEIEDDQDDRKLRPEVEDIDDFRITEACQENEKGGGLSASTRRSRHTERGAG
jgi:hypothetical protein